MNDRLDNSEWMRNGDYTPTRFEAQNDAVNLLFNAKTQSNPENTVGLMTMAGKVYVQRSWPERRNVIHSHYCCCLLLLLLLLLPLLSSLHYPPPSNSPEVLVTLTNDLGRILTAVHGIRLQGKASLSHGIQVAQVPFHRDPAVSRCRLISLSVSLSRSISRPPTRSMLHAPFITHADPPHQPLQLALKHRQHKNHRQRIIVFVGSPVEEDDKVGGSTGDHIVSLRTRLVTPLLPPWFSPSLPPPPPPVSARPPFLDHARPSSNWARSSRRTTLPSTSSTLARRRRTPRSWRLWWKVSTAVTTGTSRAFDLTTLTQPPSFRPSSHLVSVPPGPHILSDVLLSSTVVAGENGAPVGGAGFEFGVDPSMDPELALVRRRRWG